MGRCQSCEELFEKEYDRDEYQILQPSNFITLYSQNDIENVRRKEEELRQQEKALEKQEQRPKCKYCGRINEERFVTDPEEIQRNGFFLNEMKTILFRNMNTLLTVIARQLPVSSRKD